MARKPRLHFPGDVYHVTLHGNGNQQIFSDDTDRTRFLLLIQEGIEKFGHKGDLPFQWIKDRIIEMVGADKRPAPIDIPKKT